MVRLDAPPATSATTSRSRGDSVSRQGISTSYYGPITTWFAKFPVASVADGLLEFVSGGA
jgi:hypothetical protein